MFTRVASLFVLAPLLATALALPGGSPASCSSGPVQCCNSLQDAHSSSIAGLLGLLGIVVGTLTGQVGVTCSPITVIGLGGTSCSSQTVCCENNSFNGVVALGCTPINVNL